MPDYKSFVWFHVHRRVRRNKIRDAHLTPCAHAVKPGCAKTALVVIQSEESLLIQNKRQREILHAKHEHRGTFVGFFWICEDAFCDFNSCVEKFVEKNR